MHKKKNCIQCPFSSGSTIRPPNSTLASKGWLWLVHGAQDLLSPPGLALPPAAGSRSSSASPKPAPAALGSATKAGLRLVHMCRAAKRGAALPGSARLPGALGRNGGRRRVPSPCLSPVSGALRAAPRTPRPPPRPHLLLALAAEAQARGPLFVAVAVVGAGLVRLELHHPPGPGGEPCGGLGVGRERGRGKAAADGRARAPPARWRRGGGSGCQLHGSAAGQPHCPRPRPRAALTAAVATATAPSTAAAPDDDRAAILGARRRLRQGARVRGRRRACAVQAAFGNLARPSLPAQSSARPEGGRSWRGLYAGGVGLRKPGESWRVGTTRDLTVRGVAGQKAETPPPPQGQRVSGPA